MGIKDATGDMKNLSEVLKLCKEDIKSKNFFLYSGDDFSFLEFLKKGGHGTISVTSHVVPEIISEICLLVQSDFPKAKQLDDQIKNLNQSLFCESNPIPVKWALHQMGLIKNGIRLPLVELNDLFKESVKNSLEELNLI